MAELDEIAPESGANAQQPLSIGEVLAVLTEEFPDVTISKIRFLESQGLVEPERNASGYRQFRDADIERLRWILRQQRDHFLPLKVIRRALEKGVDVIDAGAGDQPTLWTAVAEAAAAEEVDRKRAETVDSEASEARRSAAQSASHPTRAGANRAAGSGSVRRRAKAQDAPRYSSPADLVAALQESPQEVAESSDDDGPEPALANSTDTNPDDPKSADTNPADPESGDTKSGDTKSGDTKSGDTKSGDTKSGDTATPDPAAIALGAGSDPETASDSERSISAGTRATSTPAGKSGGSEPDPARGARSRRADSPRSTAESGGEQNGAGETAPSGAGSQQGASTKDREAAMRQLSRDELVDEVGITEETLDALEEFGLLAPIDVAGEAVYTGREIEIARLAKRGADLGLTPRHLRIYKVAADREAGLLEQVAMPLLKQRNPASRARAAETVTELADLGASLHAALLAEELGPNLAP